MGQATVSHVVASQGRNTLWGEVGDNSSVLLRGRDYSVDRLSSLDIFIAAHLLWWCPQDV
jgi:hypothetical protein